MLHLIIINRDIGPIQIQHKRRSNRNQNFYQGCCVLSNDNCNHWWSLTWCRGSAVVSLLGSKARDASLSRSESACPQNQDGRERLATMGTRGTRLPLGQTGGSNPRLTARGAREQRDRGGGLLTCAPRARSPSFGSRHRVSWAPLANRRAADTATPLDKWIDMLGLTSAQSWISYGDTSITRSGGN